MLLILSLLLALSLSLLTICVATVILNYTGMLSESTRFEVRSTFTSPGFTTSVSEKIASLPVCRRIVLLLMLFGNTDDDYCFEFNLHARLAIS